MHVHHSNLIADGVLTTIVVAYLAIALLFWSRKRMVGEATVVSPTYLISVFVLCAGSGYLPRLIPVNETLLLYLHLALAWFAWGYVMCAVIDLMEVASEQQPRPSTEPSSSTQESATLPPATSA